MFDKRESLKVKGIAICMLLIHHLLYSKQRVTAGGVVFHWLSMDQVTQIATGMRLCVWIFAFISAYGLTKQYLALGVQPSFKEQLRFVYKRWIATMTPYWLIFAIVTLIATLAYKDPLTIFGGTFKNFCLGLFAWSDLFGTTMPVAAWWYMAFAQLVILAIPLLVELCRKFNWFTLIASFLLLPYLGKGILSKFGGYYWNYLFVVILGVLCAKNDLMEKLAGNNSRWWVRLVKGIVFFAGAVACVAINTKYSATDTWKVTKLFMALGALLTCAFSYVCLTGRWLGNVLEYLGKHSGNIFLIHAFSYTFWLKYTYWSHNAVLTFFTVLIASLICSIACQYLHKALRRLTAKRPEKALSAADDRR